MKNRMKKVLCRLMGDKAGGVMMEYVILAVLIAAAAVVAVMYFGRGIVHSLGASTQAMSGNSENAAKITEKAKTDADAAEASSGDGENQQYRKRHADK